MKENILIIIDKISNGGAQRAAVNLANGLSKSYNVILATFEIKEDNYECSSKIINLNCGKTNNKISKVYNMLKRIHKIRKIKRENNITHSISFLTVPNFINICTKLNDKTIVSIRNEMSKIEKSFIEKQMNKISCKKADIVVPVSKYVLYDQQINYKTNPKKMKVIYNFYDQEYINKRKEEEIKEELAKKIIGSKIVLTIGRLEEQKGQWHLIRAFSKVVKEIPNAKLIILGEGSLKKYFYELIKELNLEENVYIIDFDSNPYKYMNVSELFVLSSLYEGMPNVVLEAMTCGLPIISTDCNGGPREILAPNTNLKKKTNSIGNEEYGILVPPLDNVYYIAKEHLSREEELLAEAIIKLLKDNKLKQYYRNKSLERIEDFNKDKILKLWIDLLEK